MEKGYECGVRVLTEREIKALREDMRRASMYMKAEIAKRKS